MYDDSVIVKSLEFASHLITGKYATLYISNHTLESEESYDGFGIGPREAEFFMTRIDTNEFAYSDERLGGF